MLLCNGYQHSFSDHTFCDIYRVIFVILQDALRSLAQISGSANICNLFLSLLKKCGLEDTPSTPENLECEANEVDGKGEENTDSTAEINNKRFAIYPYPSIRSDLFSLG